MTAALTAAPAAPTLSVGGLRLRSPILVAPMVGITDAPFRALCAEMGAGLVSTEMVAAEGVVRRIPVTLRLITVETGSPCPVAVQLVGCDPQVIAEAGRIAVEHGAQVVDVNLGCPVRRVTGLGGGAALARDVRRTAAVLAALVDAVPVPVTAKMRTGWDAESINAPEVARALEDVGVAAVTVHGRTRAQAYTGLADWDEIARVTAAVRAIPVFGSGDVVDPATAERVIRSGRVHGIVAARGILGDLWLLRRLVTRLQGCEVPDQTFVERMELTRRHLCLLIEHHGERRALKLGRKYVAWSIRGCNGASRLRAAVQGMTTVEALHDLLDGAIAAGERPEGRFRPVFVSGDG